MSDVVSPTIDPVSTECATANASCWKTSMLELWNTKKYWIIGGVVLLILLLILGVWYYRKKKRQAEADKLEAESKKKTSRRESLRNIKLPTKPKEKKKEAAPVSPPAPQKKEKKTEEKVEETPQPTEDDFNTGVQLLDRTVKGFKDAFTDFEKTYQSMTAEQLSIEQQQKLTGKIEYILNFLRSNASHVMKLGQMLYRDAKVLEKPDEWIQEHVELKVEYVKDHFEQALQMIQHISSNVEEEQPTTDPDQELEVILEDDEEQLQQ